MTTTLSHLFRAAAITYLLGAWKKPDEPPLTDGVAINEASDLVDRIWHFVTRGEHIFHPTTEDEK
jgi:hypothetical protein